MSISFLLPSGEMQIPSGGGGKRRSFKKNGKYGTGAAVAETVRGY